MKKFISGNGLDTTSTVISYLQMTTEARYANLVLIGEAEDPTSVWLTDWESGLIWSLWGQFNASNIACGPVGSSIGLDITTMDLTWRPPIGEFTTSIATASPWQLAQNGYYDNVKVRNWVTLMPTDGDANTFGAAIRFGGRISDVTIERGSIVFQVTSFLDAIDTMVPTNLIEQSNTLASFSGATPPPGDASVPIFSVQSGSTQTKLVLAEITPNAGKLYANNVLQNGFVVFQAGSGATLAGQWSGIIGNQEYTGGPYNEVVLYTPLPWPPVVGVDTCYISGTFPVNGGQSFNFVPAPTSAI